MRTIEFTPIEQEIVDSLLPLPDIVTVNPTNVWIIEWLDNQEEKTGHALHLWMKKKREGWSHYRNCHAKDEVLRAIEEATEWAASKKMRPILHIEAHGCKQGLAFSQKSRDLLCWNELTKPLQQLNLATRCNLIVFWEPV